MENESGQSLSEMPAAPPGVADGGPSQRSMLESLLAEVSSLRRETSTNASILNNFRSDLATSLNSLRADLGTSRRDNQGNFLRTHRRFNQLDGQLESLPQRDEMDQPFSSSDYLALSQGATFEGQKMWRELRATRRKLDRLFDRVDNARPARQFPRFLELPKEMMDKIWRLAVPRRMVCINKPDKLCHLPTTLTDPAIAQVCRQSREALAWRSRQPGIWAASLPDSMIPFSQRWQIRIDRGYLWTSFTPETDALLVNPNVHMLHPLKEVVQHIVVASGDEAWQTGADIKGWPADFPWLAPQDLQNLSPQSVHHGEWQLLYFNWLDWHDYLDWNPHGAPHPFPRLHTIDLLMHGTTVVDKTFTPRFADRLFQGDDVKIVDLSDDEAVERIFKLDIEENRPTKLPHTFPTGVWAWPEGLATARRNSPIAYDLHKSKMIFEHNERQFFNHARVRIQCSYLRLHERWAPLETKHNGLDSVDMAETTFLPQELHSDFMFNEGEEPNMDIPWIRDVLGKLRIRAVHVFVRKNQGDPWEDDPVQIAQTMPKFTHNGVENWHGGWELA